jgi:hypothetical protein
MKRKIVGIVIFMLVTTTVVSATQGDVTKTIETKPIADVSLWKTNLGASSEPALFDWWCIDQKQTQTDRYGVTLIPPDTQAQSFIPTKEKLTAVSLYIFKHDTPPDPVHITVSIRDNLTHPDLVNKTIDTSTVTIKNKGSWVLFDFEDIAITPEMTYYIVCFGDAGDATNAYCWLYSFNDTYTRGEAWEKPSESSPWRKWPSGTVGDYCFKTYFRKPIDVSSTPKTNENIATATYGVDVPVWEIGDSWTYNSHQISYKYYTNGTLWYKSYHNCTLTSTVTDDTGDYYILKVTTTNNEWGVTIGKFVLKLTPFTKYSGEEVYRKTDLAYFRSTNQVKGFAFWMIGNILPFPAQYNSFFEINHTNGYRFLPFPLNDGTNGTHPSGSQTFREKASLYWGLISLFDHPAQTFPYGALDYYCEIENITVPAGDYEAYNVSIDLTFGLGVYHSWNYYVPEVGNKAKLFFKNDHDTSGKPGDIIELELVDFNYTP